MSHSRNSTGEIFFPAKKCHQVPGTVEGVGSTCILWEFYEALHFEALLSLTPKNCFLIKLTAVQPDEHIPKLTLILGVLYHKKYCRTLLLRGGIVNRTYGTDEKLYIHLSSLTICGPICYGPP